MGIGISSGLLPYMCEFSPAILRNASSNAVAGSVVLLSRTFLDLVDVVHHSLAAAFEPVRRSPSPWHLTTVHTVASAVGKGESNWQTAETETEWKRNGNGNGNKQLGDGDVPRLSVGTKVCQRPTTDQGTSTIKRIRH
jgi:hypothetical protein